MSQPGNRPSSQSFLRNCTKHYFDNPPLPSPQLRHDKKDRVMGRHTAKLMRLEPCRSVPGTGKKGGERVEHVHRSKIFASVSEAMVPPFHLEQLPTKQCALQYTAAQPRRSLGESRASDAPKVVDMQNANSLHISLDGVASTHNEPRAFSPQNSFTCRGWGCGCGCGRKGSCRGREESETCRGAGFRGGGEDCGSGA